jgi:hypothetical protein
LIRNNEIVNLPFSLSEYLSQNTVNNVFTSGLDYIEYINEEILLEENYNFNKYVEAQSNIFMLKVRLHMYQYMLRETLVMIQC